MFSHIDMKDFNVQLNIVNDTKCDSFYLFNFDIIMKTPCKGPIYLYLLQSGKNVSYVTLKAQMHNVGKLSQFV